MRHQGVNFNTWMPEPSCAHSFSWGMSMCTMRRSARQWVWRFRPPASKMLLLALNCLCLGSDIHRLGRDTSKTILILVGLGIDLFTCLSRSLCVPPSPSLALLSIAPFRLPCAVVASLIICHHVYLSIYLIPTFQPTYRCKTCMLLFPLPRFLALMTTLKISKRKWMKVLILVWELGPLGIKPKLSESTMAECQKASKDVHHSAEWHQTWQWLTTL